MNKELNVRKLLLSSATDLTLSDRRLYNYMLHNSLAKLSKQQDFAIPLTDLIGVYGIGLPPVDRLKESLVRLIRVMIEFEYASVKWVITSLLARAELDVAAEKIFYSFSSDCCRLFTNPSILERCLIQAHFTQKYSNLLYEILSEAHYAKQTNIALEIADLRSRLYVPANKLVNYSDFERFALIPAVNEINSYASFAAKFHTERKGMKVIRIVFALTSKKDIAEITDAKQVMPPKRPRFFIEDPELEQAYAYLLTAETKERRKFFDIACRYAARKKIALDEEIFDCPDLWFKWIEQELIRKIKP